MSLTRPEAERLRRLLDRMLGQDTTDEGWHAHLVSDDATCELSVGWQAGHPR